jgi:proline dehydrogenase
VLFVTGLEPVRKLVTGTSIGRRVATRFVAGESLDEGLRAARELARSGMAAMLDHLGENVASAEQASAAADQYVLALKRIHESEGLDCNIAIKLTQLGLDLGIDVAVENVERVLSAAAEGGTLVEVDMEAHGYVSATLDVVRRVRERHENVGLALQAYLYRTAEDVFRLPEGLPVRLVKGAYLEPAEVAHQRRDEVDAAFARLATTLVARGHRLHLGTHDPRLLTGTVRMLRGRGLAWEDHEMQFLYGIRRDIQRRYAEAGYPVRAYIPYGDEWYPYLTRRMAERPANLWFFVSNLIRTGG